MRLSTIFSTIFGASLALLIGCADDTPYLYVMTKETPVVHPQHPGATAIAVGSSIAVQPSMIHEEIEGSSALAVDDMSSDDTKTLTVLPTSRSYDVENSISINDRSWVLTGVAAGSTKLRLYRDHNEVGVMNIDVIAQVP